MAANTIGGGLKGVFEKSDPPADERDLPQRHVLVLEMSVPCKCHKNVGEDQQNDGDHLVRILFQRRQAAVFRLVEVSHRNAILAGKKQSPRQEAGATVGRTSCLLHRDRACDQETSSTAVPGFYNQGVSAFGHWHVCGNL